jgi:hypothetical protein
MKSKPVVKYRQATVRMCGKVHKLRYRQTLLTTFNGDLAKRIAEASEGEGLYWSYDDKKPEKLEIYEEKRLH